MEAKTRQLFIVDYAYGFDARTCEPDYVSRLRSQAALRAFKNHPNAYIILGAGMKEQTGDCGPLATMMRSYLVKEGVPEMRIIMNPIGHDTLSETAAAWDIIKDRDGGKVICATSRFHAPRVWLIWFVRYWTVPTMYVIELKSPLSECWRELYKIPRDIGRILFRLN